MIYLYNDSDNKITTDSWLEYIPDTITIYLDDILVGTYDNVSIKNEYIVLEIPAADLSAITTLENREYKLKMINNNNATLIKIELVVVLNPNTPTSNVLNNNPIIKIYE
jgi:hypothetical protein